MAVEMKKIEFKDFQEPSVGAENLNKLQDNIEEAIIEASESGGSSGDGILTGSIIGYSGEEIPEGYEEVSGISTRNIAEMRLSEGKTLTTDSSQTAIIPCDSAVIVGDKLTFNSINNSIVIGKGVSKIKTEGIMSCKTRDANNDGFNVFKNGVSVYDVIRGEASTISYSQLVLTSRIIEVTEGDYIQIACRSVGGSNIQMTINSGTYLMIDVLE